MRPFFATFALLLSAVAAFIWRVDPLGRRASTPAVTELPPGYMFPARGLNDRLLKLRLLERAPAGQALILGSSRALGWAAPHTLNLAVTNGDALDYLKLLEAAHAAGKRPATVYVELSPWTLQPRCGPGIANRFDEPPQTRYTFDELTSLTLLRQAALGLWRDDLPGALIAERNTERYGYLADGRFRYPESYLATTRDHSSRSARLWAQAPRQALLECGVDQQTLAALCERLAEVERDGARVVVLTLPWNPAALDERRAGGRASIEAAHEPVVAAVEQACGRTVRRLERACPEEDFFDAHHPRPACFAKLAP